MRNKTAIVLVASRVGIPFTRQLRFTMVKIMSGGMQIKLLRFCRGNEMKIFLALSHSFRIITSVVSSSKYFPAFSISLRTLRISFSYILFSRSYLCRHCSIRFSMSCKFKVNIFVIFARA